MKNASRHSPNKSRRILIAAAVLLAFVFSLPFAVSGILCASGRDRIVTLDEVGTLDVDCVLILGARVRDDGNPSGILEDRLITGIAAYENGASDRILMSGDHGNANYDEVNAMKAYAVEQGVPPENVFMDHAGFSTYESLYRARDVFCVESVLIVTQAYHLYRALYVAEKMGLTAYGVAADIRTYPGMPRFVAREILARNKDFFYTLFMPKPTYLGDVIPIWGDGNLTND